MLPGERPRVPGTGCNQAVPGCRSGAQSGILSRSVVCPLPPPALCPCRRSPYLLRDLVKVDELEIL